MGHPQDGTAYIPNPAASDHYLLPALANERFVQEKVAAFVEIAEGVRGLVHVSEIADRRIGHPREVLSIDDQVKVVVLDVDIRRQRLRLSIRQVDTLESAANLKEFRERQQKEQEDVQSSNAMLDALQRAKLID